MSTKAVTTGLPVFQTLAQGERIERCVSVALVGYGRRGEELADALWRVPGARLVAVADIWPWRRELAAGRMRALRRPVRLYETAEELLAAEGGRVDAVIVATPDWQHANHVEACLAAGKHVSCEGELADGAERAKGLVRLARERLLLLQGGHQRRSNPRYVHAFEKVCRRDGALGRVTHAYAQWHRAYEPLRALPERLAVSEESLARFGYPGMEAFLNWEWFRRYGAGPCGAHTGQKLDLMRWFWDAEPESVSAEGGRDRYGRENADNLMAMFTFRKPDGERVRGYIQVLSGVSRGGSYEQFMGEYAALTIAEVAACGDAVQPEEERVLKTPPVRQVYWDPFVRAGDILPLREPPKLPQEDVVVDSRVSKNAPGWPLPFRLDKPALQPHVENFVAAVRGETALADPGEQAYANLVGLEGALRAARERRAVDFTPQDFLA